MGWMITGCQWPEGAGRISGSQIGTRLGGRPAGRVGGSIERPTEATTGGLGEGRFHVSPTVQREAVERFGTAWRGGNGNLRTHLALAYQFRIWRRSWPGWRNGRRSGLKIRYLRVCGFESLSRHHQQFSDENPDIWASSDDSAGDDNTDLPTFCPHMFSTRRIFGPKSGSRAVLVRAIRTVRD